jgi:hypothetical protein
MGDVADLASAVCFVVVVAVKVGNRLRAQAEHRQNKQQGEQPK